MDSRQHLDGNYSPEEHAGLSSKCAIRSQPIDIPAVVVTLRNSHNLCILIEITITYRLLT